MFLQRITKPLAWSQLIVSVGIIATVIYGQLKLHDTWAANSPLLESTKSSLQHAQESLAQANKTLPGIKEGVPTLEAALRTVSVALMTTADVMDKLSNNMRFSAPTSIEMQGIKPVFVMTRPLEPSANDFKAQANVIRATGISLQNTADSVHTLPAVLSEIGETMAASQAAIGQLEPMIGQIMILMNWGSLIALLIATWCFLNSLSTLALAHKKPTATNLSGVI